VSGRDDSLDGDTSAVPPGLLRALRDANSPAPLDAAIDRSIRERIRAHTGFGHVATSGGATTDAARAGVENAGRAARTARRRWLVRGSMAGGALATAAALVLWLTGTTATWFERRAPVSVAPLALERAANDGPSRAARDLGEAVRLTRRAGGVNSNVAALLAAIVTAAPATGEMREAGARFIAVDLFVEVPAGESLDGYVVDLIFDDPRAVIVGIGSGDAPFDEPPTYDAERLARGEIRLAAVANPAAHGAHDERGAHGTYGTSDTSRRLRIATLSLHCSDAGPVITITPVSAVAEHDGDVVDIHPRWSFEPRSTP